MKRSIHKVRFNDAFNNIWRSGSLIVPEDWLTMLRTFDGIAGSRLHWTKEERVEVLLWCRRRINSLIVRIQMQEFEDPLNP